MSFFDRFKSLAKREELKPAAVVPTASAAVAPASATERRNRKRKNARQGATALIIDDSPTVVAALRKILRSAGYVTRDAGDAEKGLALIAESKPDLIFLDIVLPGMNGFGALRAIRKDPATQHIPVVMISGNEHATEQFYANKIGADDFMKKPFSRYEVFAHIEMLLDANRLLRRKGAMASTLLAAPHDVQEEMLQTLPVPRAATSLAQASPAPMQPAPPLTRWSELDARTQLTAMGLKYFDVAQFLSAIQRNDQLAVALFVAGKGVPPNASVEGKTPRDVAQESGDSELVRLLG